MSADFHSYGAKNAFLNHFFFTPCNTLVSLKGISDGIIPITGKAALPSLLILHNLFFFSTNNPKSLW